MLIDRNDAKKVLRSMMKIMEEIFTGTIMRFMGRGEPVSKVDLTGSEGKDPVIQQEVKTVLTPPAHVVQRETNVTLDHIKQCTCRSTKSCCFVGFFSLFYFP